MHYRHLCILGFFVLFIVQSTPFSFGVQASENPDTAKISGRVSDGNDHSPLPYVQVFIASLKRGDVSNLRGEFQIDKLPPGQYQVTFKLQGYKTLRSSTVIVASDETVELNVAMSPKIIEFEHLFVTATRSFDSTYDVPQLATVVSAREIRERNLQQTPELLREEVGVVVQKTNQGGGSVIIRGLKANKLLLLVDGIRLNNSTYRGGNTQYLNTVDSEILERLEVVHGPISVLYGSDALGGVVNVITKTPLLSQQRNFKINGSFSGSISTADRTRTGHLSMGTASNKFGLLAEGSFKSFGDIERGSSGGKVLMQRLQNDSRITRVLSKKQSPNGYDAYDLSSKALFKLSNFQEIRLAYQLNRQNEVPRYDVVETQQDSIRLFDPQERDLVYLRYFNNAANEFFNSLTATISFHRQFERRIRQRFGSSNQTIDQFGTWTTGLQLQLNKVVARKHHFVYGAEFYYDDVSTRSSQHNTNSGEISVSAPLFPDRSSFLIFGLFAQDTYDVSSKWWLTAGARLSTSKLKAPFEEDLKSAGTFDNIEQSSTSFTGSLGSQMSLTEDISFVTNIAQGFRTPNLDDVSKLGPGKGSSFFDVPNSDVQPEKSLSFDAGLRIYSDKMHANVMGYYNYIADLLVRKPTKFNGLPVIVEEGDTLVVFHKENAGQAFTTGLALISEILLNSNLSIFGNLSYTYGQNISDDEPLSGIPPFIGLLGLRWRMQRTWTEINARFAGEQSRLSTEDEADLRIPEGGTPGWYTLNFRFGMLISRHISFRLSVSNILDRNYREHLSGFNAPGRNFVFGAEFSY